jgi:hypothetical protein
VRAPASLSHALPSSHSITTVFESQPHQLHNAAYSTQHSDAMYPHNQSSGNMYFPVNIEDDTSAEGNNPLQANTSNNNLNGMDSQDIATEFDLSYPGMWDATTAQQTLHLSQAAPCDSPQALASQYATNPNSGARMDMMFAPYQMPVGARRPSQQFTPSPQQNAPRSPFNPTWQPFTPTSQYNAPPSQFDNPYPEYNPTMPQPINVNALTAYKPPIPQPNNQSSQFSNIQPGFLPTPIYVIVATTVDPRALGGSRTNLVHFELHEHQTRAHVKEQLQKAMRENPGQVHTDLPSGNGFALGPFRVEVYKIKEDKVPASG